MDWDHRLWVERGNQALEIGSYRMPRRMDDFKANFMPGAPVAQVGARAARDRASGERWSGRGSLHGGC